MIAVCRSSVNECGIRMAVFPKLKKRAVIVLNDVCNVQNVFRVLQKNVLQYQTEFKALQTWSKD